MKFRSDTHDLVVMAELFVLTLVIKSTFIAEQPIGGDEPLTVFYAQTDYGTLFEMFKMENKPPLYTLLLKCWMLIFGDAVVSV